MQRIIRGMEFENPNVVALINTFLDFSSLFVGFFLKGAQQFIRNLVGFRLLSKNPFVFPKGP